MAGHYEAIRQALLHDSLDGITTQAEELRQSAEELRLKFDAATAAGLAPKIEIDDARASFGELSRATVRYRQMLAKPESMVVYCAMAEQVWIQPEGDIGNPYYGQSMAGCGEIVSE